MQRKIGNPNNYFECKNYYYNPGFCLMLFLFYIFFRSSKSTKNLPMIIVVYLGWGLFFYLFCKPTSTLWANLQDMGVR